MVVVSDGRLLPRFLFLTLFALASVSGCARNVAPMVVPATASEMPTAIRATAATASSTDAPRPSFERTSTVVAAPPQTAAGPTDTPKPPPVTVTPTPVRSSTPPPTRLPTLPPENVGGLMGIPDWKEDPGSKQLVQAATGQFGKVMGLDPATVELMPRVFQDNKRNAFVIAVTPDGTPLLIATRTEGLGWVWRSVGYKDVAPSDLTLGAALTVRDSFFTRDPKYRQTFELLFNLGVNDGGLSAAALFRSVPNKKITPEEAIAAYNWSGFDPLAEYLREKGLPLRVQGADTTYTTGNAPEWMKLFSNDELVRFLGLHSGAVLTRYQASEALVVNEAFWHNDSFVGMPGNSFLFSRLGKDHVRIAFEAARATAPKTKLIINENFAYEKDTHILLNRESDAFFTFVQEQKNNGVPIDGVGIQSHVLARDFTNGDVNQNVQRFKQQNIEFMRRFKTIGVEAHITELDVNIGGLPADWSSEQGEELKSMIYKAVFEAAIESGNCRSITTWGFTNKATWMNTNYPYKPAASPLPIDSDYQPTKAFYSVLQTLYKEYASSRK